jgi:glycosyltransferase involved in cell wall biosynthesis
MRIAHVVPTYFPAVRYGGPIYSVHGLARGLVKLGHEVDVFTTNVDGPGVSDVPLGSPVDMEGVRVWYFPAEWPRRVFRAPRLVQCLANMLPQATAVHLHSVFLWPTWAAARAARRAEVPYVLSPRGMLIKSLIRSRSRVAKSAWIHFVERNNVEGASAIHLTSQLEAAELKSFGWRLPELAVIPNGIDDPSPNSQDISADIRVITADQPFVLFLGRLSWKKALDRLLHAFARTRIGKLAIVGTDDEQLGPQLVALASQLGIANRVHILPRTVVGAEKEHLFATARLFVLPSHSENFGNTVLEAMRRSIPVVVTPGVGAAEVVQKAGGGLVVDGEAESLGAAMSRLLEDSNLAHSLGQAGQRHVLDHYSWAQIAVQMEALYRGLSMPEAARSNSLQARMLKDSQSLQA